MDQLFFTTSVSKDSLKLQEQEAVHCALVLRKREGDIIHVIDGKGNRFKAGIDSLTKREVSCTILSTESQEQSESLTIAIAPTKNRDRLEWMIEKLTEIGVKSIVLMNTANTERTRSNMDRLIKKALSATKQSLRFYVPAISEMEFEDVLQIESEVKCIAHCYAGMNKSMQTDNKASNHLILIGPEGDFTKDEVEQAFAKGFVGLDLGEFRLRTETAAIVAAARFQ